MILDLGEGDLEGNEEAIYWWKDLAVTWTSMAMGVSVIDSC